MGVLSCKMPSSLKANDSAVKSGSAFEKMCFQVEGRESSHCVIIKKPKTKTKNKACVSGKQKRSTQTKPNKKQKQKQTRAWTHV
jgi:hypothetical protein